MLSRPDTQVCVISASMGSDIRVITSTTTRIITHIPINNYGAY
jgi:hypothetical protein